MPDQQGGLLAKSGLDSIKVGGKKIPIALIGGVAAVAGVILFIRARNAGQNVAQIGAVPAAANTGVNPVIDYGTSGVAPDYSAALANLNQQLVGIQQSISNPQSTQTTTTTASSNVLTAGSSAPTLSSFGGQIPLYGMVGGKETQISTVPFGTQFTPTGGPLVVQPWPSVNGGTMQASFIPVTFQGQTEYVSGSDVTYPSVTH